MVKGRVIQSNLKLYVISEWLIWSTSLRFLLFSKLDKGSTESSKEGLTG